MGDPVGGNFADHIAQSLASRYRIERELGRGGMATVFLAEDRKHGRAVAIKVLHEELGAWLGAERFLAEIRITARLQHPHILPLLDSGDADGRALLCHAVRQRRDASREASARAAARRRGGRAHREGGRLGARLRARGGRHPPRHQTGEHPPRHA